MAPSGVLAARLALFVLLFLLFMVCLIPQFGQTLWIYNRQALFNIRSSVPDFSGAGQYYSWLVRPLPAGILRPMGSANGRKKRRRRQGCRVGASEKAKRARSVFSSRARDLRLPCLRAVCPVVLFSVPRPSVPRPYYTKKRINFGNLCYLRKIGECNSSVPTGNTLVRMALVNARSLAN